MVNFLQYAIRLCAVFLFGSTGETISQKGGHLNLGIPGIMCMGVAGGAVGSKIYLSIIGNNQAAINNFWGFMIPFLCALIFGAIFGLLFSYFTVTLHCNQNVMGLALTTFGVGFAILIIKILGNTYYMWLSKCFTTFIYNAETAPNTFAMLFLSYGPLVYLAIIVSFASQIIIKRTKVGLNLRAVGENPATADAAGINVDKYRYLATMIGCAIASLGGLFFFMDKQGGTDATKVITNVEEFGWMAVALVIFTMWRPDFGVLGSIIFAILYTVPSFYRVKYEPLNTLIALIPYVVTVLVLIITSIFFRRASKGPSSLGVNYFREDR